MSISETQIAICFPFMCITTKISSANNNNVLSTIPRADIKIVHKFVAIVFCVVQKTAGQH